MGPAGKIEDAEPAMAETDGGVAICSFGIRAAVGEGAGHGSQRLFRRFRLVAKGGETGDAAHRPRFEDKAGGFKRGAWGRMTD